MHCSACGRSDQETAFYPSIRTMCKACRRMKYEEPNRERTRERCRLWREAHPTANKDWHVKNRQHKLEYGHAYRESKADSIKASYAVWARANPWKKNARTAARIAAKKRATVSWAKPERILAIYAEASRITKETGIRHEVDHIVPLQSPLVSGLHWEGNLQILTKTANLQKSNKVTHDA